MTTFMTVQFQDSQKSEKKNSVGRKKTARQQRQRQKESGAVKQLKTKTAETVHKEEEIIQIIAICLLNTLMMTSTVNVTCGPRECVCAGMCVCIVHTCVCVGIFHN